MPGNLQNTQTNVQGNNVVNNLASSQVRSNLPAERNQLGESRTSLAGTKI